MEEYIKSKKQTTIPDETFFSVSTTITSYFKNKKTNLWSGNTNLQLMLAKLLLFDFISELNLDVKLTQGDPISYFKTEKLFSFFPWSGYLYVFYFKRQPLLFYRFALTYLSYLYIFNGDENKARKALEQTSKRCVIKDFWRWIIKEDYPKNRALADWEQPHAKTYLYIYFLFSSYKTFPIVAPHYFFSVSKEQHYLDYYEFTLNGWEKTEAQKYDSQGEGNYSNVSVIESYNLKTCDIEKINLKEYNHLNYNSLSTLLSFEDFEWTTDYSYGNLYPDSNGFLSLAILPPRLSSFIYNSFLEIKNQLDNESPNEGELIKELRKEIEKDQENNPFKLFKNK